MREHLKSQFDLGEMYWLEVSNETPGLGGFRINGNPTIWDSSHSGYYFPDYPLKIEWMPKDGFCSIERETIWIQAVASDTVRLVNGFKPNPRSPYTGKLFMTKWKLGADSLPGRLVLSTLDSEDLTGSKWTLRTHMGDTTFLLPAPVHDVRTIQLGEIPGSKSLQRGGWMHLLDSCAFVVDSLSWDTLGGSNEFARASHLDHAWRPILQDQTDEQARNNYPWLVSLLILLAGGRIGYLLVGRKG